MNEASVGRTGGSEVDWGDRARLLLAHALAAEAIDLLDHDQPEAAREVLLRLLGSDER